MKVIIDTNVMISYFWGGKPKEILRLWCSGELILYLNQEILDEYFNVLRRMGLVESEASIRYQDCQADPVSRLCEQKES